MKKLILTSIFSLFILAGTGMLYANAIDCDPQASATKTTKVECTSPEKAETATAVQTSNKEAKACCDSSKSAAVKTAETSKAACNSTGEVKATQASSSSTGECQKLPSGLRASKEE